MTKTTSYEKNISPRTAKLLNNDSIAKCTDCDVSSLAMNHVESPDVSQSGTSEPTLCRFCNGTTRPHWRRGLFNRCLSCGLLMRNRAAEGAELDRLYRQSWLDPDFRRSETGGTELAHSRVYAAKLARALHIKDFTGLRICDFGAGRGSMSQALSELGAEIYAVEPFGYDFLIKQGIRAFRNLRDLPPGVELDGVVSISVLEHLDTPWQALRQIRERLKPSGWAYLATPNANGLVARIAHDRWREAVRPGHLVLLTAKMMAKILEWAGYSSYRRLRWCVAYQSGARNLFGYALQMSGLDGELRYLAFK